MAAVGRTFPFRGEGRKVGYRRILVIPDTPAKAPSPNPQPPHALGSGDLAVIVTGAC